MKWSKSDEVNLRNMIFIMRRRLRNARIKYNLRSMTPDITVKFVAGYANGQRWGC